MTSFNVHGWFEIDYEKRKGGRTLVFENFWSEGSKARYLEDECGCYVFAVKTGRGLEPIYVGKATKTFKQETFNPANKHKYHDGFSEYAKGLPLMFFVVHPDQRGKTNEKQIEKIEVAELDTGKRDLKLERIRPLEALNNTRDRYCDEASRKRIRVELSAYADLGAVQADRRALRSILDNLLANALRRAQHESEAAPRISPALSIPS